MTEKNNPWIIQLKKKHYNISEEGFLEEITQLNLETLHILEQRQLYIQLKISQF